MYRAIACADIKNRWAENARAGSSRFFIACIYRSRGKKYRSASKIASTAVGGSRRVEKGHAVPSAACATCYKL